MKMVDAETRKSEEVLRVNTNKMREADYLDRVMKRLNSELSPFRDKSTFDADYVRAMWTKYTQLEALRANASEKEIAEDLPKVAAFVKTLQDGADDKDARTLQDWADGKLSFDDKQVRDYYIQQLQKTRA